MNDGRLNVTTIRKMYILYKSKIAKLSKFNTTFAYTYTSLLLYLITMIVILPFTMSVINAAVPALLAFYILFSIMMQFAEVSKFMVELIQTINNLPLPEEPLAFLTLLEVQQKVARGPRGVTFFDRLFTKQTVLEEIWKLVFTMAMLYGFLKKFINRL